MSDGARGRSGVYSLRGRLLWRVSGLLVLFFALTIFGLDLAFRRAGEQAVRDVLEVRVVMLLGAAEPDERGLTVAADLPDSRFAQPGSGLLAELLDARGEALWRSASSAGLGVPLDRSPGTGERYFRRVTASDGDDYLALAYGVEWEFEDGAIVPFVVQAAENLDGYHAQVAKFRRQMGGWFLASLLLLLVSTGGLLGVLLRPLKRIETEIEAVEQGRAEGVGSGYPRELEPVTRNMNALIQTARLRLERHRNALGDLAHSLKTPLAVARGQLEGAAEPDRQVLAQQLDRMDEIVRYQLQRAAAAGGAGPGSVAVDAVEVARGLVRALDKVYADKAPEVALDLPGQLVFHGDRGDLMELLGNLLDNAYKYCHRRLRLVMEEVPGPARPGLRLVIEDDGPGFPPGMEQTLLKRGMRADERVEGQGIGLAVAQEIALACQGSLALAGSALGGSRVTVELPGA